MKLDLIYDIQRAYRKVVDSMSKPGLITNLKDEAAKVDLEAGCFPSTLVLAAMLLDTEVTFKVVSEREHSCNKEFSLPSSVGGIKSIGSKKWMLKYFQGILETD